VRAKFDYTGKDERYLSFKKGDELIILEKNKSWWTGCHPSNRTKEGFIPANYIEIIETTKSSSKTSSPKNSSLTLSPSPTSEPKVLLEALFDFKGTKSHHLSFTKGDRVVLVEKDLKNKGWWRGYLEADPTKSGKFPTNYVKELKSKKKESILVKAIHAHKAKDDSYLSFDKDAQIMVSKKSDNWWYGKLLPDKSQKGWFPANYVQTIGDE